VATLLIRLIMKYIEYTNVSVYNTIYFLYIKWYIVRVTCFDLHWVIFRPSRKPRFMITLILYKNAL